MDQIVFNPEKHHLRAIVSKIQEFAERGEERMSEFLSQLVNKGVHRNSYNGIIDVYYGKFSVTEIKAEVAEFLKNNGIEDFDSYKNFVESNGEIKRRGHYICIEISDKTVLTLRIINDDNHFVHIHPGRYSPNTFRVKANTLKTAIIVLFLAICRGKETQDLGLINEARAQLGLSPVNKDAASIYSTIEKLQDATQR